MNLEARQKISNILFKTSICAMIFLLGWTVHRGIDVNECTVKCRDFIIDNKFVRIVDANYTAGLNLPDDVTFKINRWWDYEESYDNS